MTRIHDTWATKDSPIGLELYYSGAWHDITADLGDDGVQITRGRSAEGQRVDPAEMSCRLKNSTGTYSPRNPASALYGVVGRNTPIRFWAEAGTPRLVVEGVDATASAPDSAALSVSGDFDVRIDADLDSWRTATTLVHKWVTTGNQRTFAFQVAASGKPVLQWSTDGTATAGATSTAPLPHETGRLTVRATFDANNGAGGSTTTFYYSDTAGLAGPWTQLGDPVVVASTVTLYNSTAPLAVGDSSSLGRFTGVVHSAELRSSIGGTVVASPDFGSQTSGAASFADAQGNTWTINSPASLTDRHYRFSGEVVSWPQKWGLKGAPSAYSPIECAGVTRRLGQGTSPLKSAYYRGCTSPVAPVTGLKAYWPCEDAVGSTSLASGLPGGAPMVISGTPTLADVADSFPCSTALPDVGTASFAGNVTDYASTGQIQVRLLLAVPAAGTTNGAVLLSLRCGGTAARWELVYGTGGTLALNAYSSVGASLLVGGAAAHGVNGVPLRLSLQLTQNGANVDYAFATLPVGLTVGTSSTATLAGQSVTAAQSVTLAPGKNLAGVTMGHVTVQSAVTSAFDLDELMNAYNGETASDRITRLCAEESLGIDLIGGTDTQAMGYQGTRSLLELLQEAEDVDQGILYEPRSSSDLAYRAHVSLWTQRPAVAITYTDNLLNPFEPTEDDQRTRNRVTITREGGTSYTSEVTTGPLNTSSPTVDPEGVGVYDEEKTLPLYSDSQVADQATWRTHIGTVDEARWPKIGVDLAHPTIKADTDLVRDILTLDLGDRITVTDLPDWLPPFDVDQIVQGYIETITPKRFKITLNCTPASPYRVGVYDGAGESRYSGEGTTLAEDLDTTETGINITAPTGVQWTHDDGDYDVITGGEVMTVTGLSGTAPNYTFTVIRSVNGVVKSHSNGAAIDVAEPCYYGI